ncbi:hypothetical protein AJ80_09912 [Polytolypa hystricis UAMH7299]|uniref:Probable E3 ubiquitin ligase complex SCF subunit sconB n=1 Tax=Polytolypa hystricis (strain UAMH7299) TaxID=1447883 RepID=A0A2B7WGQ5_POLH7|nr:hypothetical protein AJ80_09912 [Polytolypa hystricis UAMH7299]
MSPTSPSTSRSVRRRPSVLIRVRPQTSGGDIQFSPLPVRPHTGVWMPHEDGSYKDVESPFPPHEGPVFEYPDPEGSKSAVNLQVSEEELPTSPSRRTTRHRPSKSFSSIRHGVSELRAVARRLSLSIRHKSSKQHLEVPLEEGDSSSSRAVSEVGNDDDSGNVWLHSQQRLPHRPSVSSLNALSRFSSPVLGDVSAPIPGNGAAPPVLPHDLSRGAAARAAAAAQNEMLKIERIASMEESKALTPTVYSDTLSRDSESGIGISIMSPMEVAEEELDVVRQDPVTYLPSELMAQILAFLDAESVKNAELVSRSWHSEASSRHVWREVFRSEFGWYSKRREKNNGQPRSLGLGKPLPNQDWKNMLAIRRRLEQRWKDGEATAIYLQGHKDTVYCAQFDEDKIITGSRDRTIRVWQARSPWRCVKVLGTPKERDDFAPLPPVVFDAEPDAPGFPPLMSLYPTTTAKTEPPYTQPKYSHTASILCLQYDDEILVTGSSDHTCIIWDIKDDYRAVARLEAHKGGVLDVCFNKKYIVSCSKDTTLCVWDRNTGVLLKRLLGHRGPVNAVQLRGDLVVSASGDGVAKLWNIASGQCVKEFPSRDRGLACVEFSEDGRTILTGGNDHVIYQFDANTGELVNELKGHENLVRSVYLDSQNGRIVSGSYDLSVKVFDAKTGELALDFPGWTTSWILRAKSDYRRIVAVSQDSRAVIMDFGFMLDGIELLEE